MLEQNLRHQHRFRISRRAHEHSSAVCSRNFAAPARGRMWQIRIPLAGSHYINFFRDFDAEMNPVILSAFVSAVERILQARIAQLEQEVQPMPVPETPLIRH